MAMTSAQIKSALAQLSNIFSALYGATEIVAAAEAAELKLKEYPDKLKVWEQREDELKGRVSAMESSYLKAKGDYSTEITALETSKTKAKQGAVEANKNLTDLTGQINKAQVELTRLRDHGRAEVDDEIAAYRKSKESQISEIDAALAEKEKELKRAESAYEAFKKRAGLV